jgi:hypothetical protein
MQRRISTMIAALSVLLVLFAGPAAHASRAHFRYAGGRWSHHYHAGWHRYWGGPSIGFYYAPYPVYLVAGYSDPGYYVGPSFWYSNPAFGLSINLGGGGGGGWYGGGGGGRYGGGGHMHRGHAGFGGRNSGSFGGGHAGFGGRTGGSFGGGHSGGGGMSSGGDHSGGGGMRGGGGGHSGGGGMRGGGGHDNRR